MNPQLIRLQLELAIARLKWFPIVMLALLGAVAAIYFIALPSLAQHERQAQVEASKLKQAPKVVTVRPKDPLAAFDSVLMSEAKQVQFLRSLSQQAAQSGLKLGRIDFRSERGVDTGFDRFTIVMPVTGRYPVIQGLAFGLLAEYPGLSLEKIELRRELANQEELEAQLHFVLHMEPSS